MEILLCSTGVRPWVADKKIDVSSKERKKKRKEKMEERMRETNK